MERLEELRGRLAELDDPVTVLAGIFAYAPLPLQLYSAQGRSILTNQAFRELFAAEPPPTYNVLHDEIAEREGVLTLIRRAFAGEVVQLPPVWYDPRELNQVRIAQANRVAIEATCFPIFDRAGAVEYVAVIFKDRTAELQAREAAERERDDAREAVRERDEFIAVAAHELKTPITSLRGYAQLLLRQLDRSGDLNLDRIQRALDVLDRQSQKLADLLSQLLDVSRIQGGRLELTLAEADLAELIRAVGATMSLSLAPRTVNVDVPDALPARIDAVRIEQVLVNLLDNAAKFSPPDATVDVRLTIPAPNLAQITVRDHGRGIPPEHRDRVFDRFYQVERTGSAPGFGLGLFISRQIVELHGGRISLEPADGGGTRAVVQLPTGITCPEAAALRRA